MTINTTILNDQTISKYTVETAVDIESLETQSVLTNVNQSIVTSVNTITLENNILKVNLTKDVWNSAKITNTQKMLLKTLAIQFSNNIGSI